MSKRKFFQYELNWLKKFDFNLDNLDSIGETPVEYVTGHADFLNQDFQVTSDTLIPRIETEEIISIAVDFVSNLPAKHLNIADIGTGSGCIGISIAKSLIKNNNSFDIYLSDISSKALAIAKINSENILKSDHKRVHFLNSNLLEGYSPDIKFDLIVSNLPYIPTQRIRELDISVKDFEPVSALDGGENGTALINQLLTSIYSHLETNFMIILEIDSIHTIDMFSLPSNTSGSIKKDSFDRSRFLVVRPIQ